MWAGISSTSRSLALVRTSLGAMRQGASARRIEWVVAMTSAARDALVGDVADHDADLVVGQLDEVVEVAADLAGGP